MNKPARNIPFEDAMAAESGLIANQAGAFFFTRQ